MQPLLSSSQDWRRPLWLTLLIAASIAFTFGFACAVPFAAFSAATALTLAKRDALIVTVGIWLANQVTGFAFLGYPTDSATLAWGAAFLIVALASLAAARITAHRLRNLPTLAASTVAFLAAFAAYELTCYASAMILGGTEEYTLAVQGRIFAINACALLILFALNRAGSALRLTAFAKHA